jgi:hypothetical protein
LKGEQGLSRTVRPHEKAPIHQSKEEVAEDAGLEVLTEVDIDSVLIVGDQLRIFKVN